LYDTAPLFNKSYRLHYDSRF